jgi:hypothetical protein
MGSPCVLRILATARNWASNLFHRGRCWRRERPTCFPARMSSVNLCVFFFGGKMCRMGVAQENGAHILCQIALLQFALQCASCYWRNGRSRREVSHSAHTRISRFIPCVLTFLPVYAYFTCCHHLGVVVLRNFRFSKRCWWRFPHSWLWRLGDCCLHNNLWDERNVGPYTSTYTSSRPEWRESGSLLHLLQPSCLLWNRNTGGASHNLLVCCICKIIDKISSHVTVYVEFTKAFFTFRLSYGFTVYA